MSHSPAESFTFRFFNSISIKLTFIFYLSIIILLIKWEMIYFISVIYIAFYAGKFYEILNEYFYFKYSCKIFCHI